jgi:hypothetical protein
MSIVRIWRVKSIFGIFFIALKANLDRAEEAEHSAVCSAHRVLVSSFFVA